MSLESGNFDNISSPIRNRQTTHSGRVMSLKYMYGGPFGPCFVVFDLDEFRMLAELDCVGKTARAVTAFHWLS
jgi:hypothetical protein